MIQKIQRIVSVLALLVLPIISFSQPILVEYNRITSGADQLSEYLPGIDEKNIAVVANHSSLIGETHLVDSLVSLGVNINKIFCPEHGFRGDADAGKTIKDSKDIVTGIPIISLYSSHKKPTIDDLDGVDIILFDLQDVGTRFYTYISTLTYVMEACAENRIPMIVLDRPNPNGFYVDGPVLKSEFKSFVGMHPVPIVYGMTIGEYAKMVKGEEWINNASNLKLDVIKLKGYDHNMIVKLKVKPSPNLPNWESVYLYPSLCLFEGTIMSVGRGTKVPFQVYGHPNFMIGSYIFTPAPTAGASNPKYNGLHCFGSNLTGLAHNYNRNEPGIKLWYLIGAYEVMNKQAEYFNSYFDKLAGNSDLKSQIKEGKTEQEIKKSWKEDLDNFKKIRSKYLIYD